MGTFRLPYGKSHIVCEVPDEQIVDVLNSNIQHYVPEGTPDELVANAMANPIGSSTLEEMAKGKKKITIIASDHTRPVPSKVIIPPMLAAIRKGNPDAEITILIATGCHRETKLDEFIDKFGSEIVEKEHIVIHDCDTEDVVDLGKLPSGGALVVNSVAVNADLLVAEGFIEPHFFAGFSGGRKSVLPGVAGRKVVLANHNGAFIDDVHARTGNLEGNPIHRDMIYAAKKAGLKYIVNVVLNERHDAIYAVAGDVEQAHLEGCKFLASQCQVQPAEEADIVITTNGGFPLDQNVYQAVKGMTAAENAVKKNGVIIMLSKCNDGHGGEHFYKTFEEEKNLEKMMQTFISTPPDETVIDQWQSQIFARVLMKARVIFVADVDETMIENFQMIPAKNVEEALAKAKEILKTEKPKITIIPDGVGVIVKPVG